MILVIIPQPGKQPRLVAFAKDYDFMIFANNFKNDYSVQYIEDGCSLADDFVKNEVDKITGDVSENS